MYTINLIFNKTIIKMKDKEFFIETLKDELPRFERVIKAMEKIPKNKLSHKHDPKSRTAFELLTQTIGVEATMFPVFLKTGKIDFATHPKANWKKVTEVLRAFTKSMKDTEKIVTKMTQKEWKSKAVMMFNKKVDWETTRGKFAWAFLLDLIHHRGQLSTYLRPMGGKVPSIYGPSADSK